MWRSLYHLKDKFNVCGFSSLATLLEIIGNVRGAVVDYHMWHEEATDSAVSYAAGVLWSLS